MPKTYSPLRYPGGKAKTYNLVQPIISKNLYGTNKIYIEPFAGGCGLALKLLLRGDVNRIILNDIDYHIFCFWNECINNADTLCNLIEHCKIDMDTWKFEKEIYENPKNYSEAEIAFSTFFLNRCNVSGIISGGPIGGHKQTGNYGLDARFNRDELIKKIQWISEKKDVIEFYNMDAGYFMREQLQQYEVKNTFLNIDPPYVKKGPQLYKNSFSEEEHAELADTIRALDYKWIVTYDECEIINNLYSEFRKDVITLSYSVGKAKSGRELLIYSDSIKLSFD